ncbi:AT-hook motif nuclear-localized protein 10-like [Coffea arabica]|uniref:AT-hook motif nuclear-localized protein n=1 Tax=Coffea arabica TaxID=13443 RepID=A0ABM4VV29_COFAR
MSASEAGGGGGGEVITATITRDNTSFSLPSIQKSPPPPPAPPQPQSLLHSLSFAYPNDPPNLYKPPLSASSPPYQPATADSSAPASSGLLLSNNVNLNSGADTVKRKRGRPRKYGPDGSIAMALMPSPPPTAAAPPPPGVHFSPSLHQPPSLAVPPPSGMPSSPSPSTKKARGRPPGSGKKQPVEALGSVGIGFTPHVITVKAGEDVSAKIMSFSQHGPRAVCILSANGAISNVTLRQTATSGGTATYEGRFDILSLSGSFLLSEVGGQRSRTGGLSISLAGPDGRVLGGCVAGLLTAASPVQVIVGSFVADGRKESKTVNHVAEPSHAPLKVNPSGASSPPSRGTLSLSESSGSPLNHSTGACNNVSAQGMPWK